VSPSLKNWFEQKGGLPGDDTPSAVAKFSQAVYKPLNTLTRPGTTISASLLFRTCNPETACCHYLFLSNNTRPVRLCKGHFHASIKFLTIGTLKTL
jgi:hypothetical protein